jgi:hypothetical protein
LTLRLGRDIAAVEPAGAFRQAVPPVMRPEGGRKMKCRHLATALLLLPLGACAFSTQAKDWSGLQGLDGKPTYYIKTTKVGLNLFIAVPLIGNMSISGLTRDLTSDIRARGGNEVRIVQGTSEAYFYGWPPFTWVITPVISTVAAEYTPNEETYRRDQIDYRDHDPKRWYMPWTW